MRHGKKVNHLSRQAGHRKAMLANMACSLIEHKRINTTVAKAKALKVYVEPLITKSKEDTTHNRRIVFSYLKSKYAVTELFRDIAPKVGDRPGGYTRIIKLGNRLGDNADMAMIELVDFNELYNGGKEKLRKQLVEAEEPKKQKQLRLKKLRQRKKLLQKRQKLKNKVSFLSISKKDKPRCLSFFCFILLTHQIVDCFYPNWVILNVHFNRTVDLCPL